jgi:hypothetical protein
MHTVSASAQGNTGSGGVGPSFGKNQIREEIEEVIDNKISNLAVEQMEEKE